MNRLKQKFKPLLRKAYFGIFNSRLFDLLNYAAFERFFKRKAIKLGKADLHANLPGERVLVLAPHIDDEFIGCGGAILRYLQAGKEVYIAYLTNSGKQGSGTGTKEIAAERRQEAVNAGLQAGIDEARLYFLSGQDGRLLNSPIEEELAGVLRAVKPDTIFLPSLLDTHWDHYAASKKLCAVYAREPELLEGVTLFLYESQSPVTYLFGNVFLDISDLAGKKKALLEVFVSQPYSFKFVGELNKATGLLFGKKLKCESFIQVAMNKYAKFVIQHFADDAIFAPIRDSLVPNNHSGSLIPSYLSSMRHKTLLKELL